MCTPPVTASDAFTRGASAAIPRSRKSRIDARFVRDVACNGVGVLEFLGGGTYFVEVAPGECELGTAGRERACGGETNAGTAAGDKRVARAHAFNSASLRAMLRCICA